MSHILIVDDCEVDTLLARRALASREQWFVATASNGANALEMLDAAPFDIVVSDIRMPKVDGLALLNKMRENHPDVPVIITTSHGSEAIALKAIQGGAASYVPKTHLRERLADVVDSILAKNLTKQNKDRLLKCITSQQLEITLPDNDRKFVPSVVQYLQQLACAIGLTDSSDSVQLGVALEETLINAVVHGNLEISSQLKQQADNVFADTVEAHRRMEPYKSRVVTVSVSLTSEEGRFTITDEGPGFDITKLPDPLDPENLLKPSGRGITLINAFMDHVEFNETGNQICLVKKRKAEVIETKETIWRETAAV